jgi:hypothetical protein
LEGSYTVTETVKNPKFPQNLRPISLLSKTGKIFQKVILKIVQKHIEERSLLNGSQLGFRARHSNDTSMYEAYRPHHIKFQQ